MNVWSAIVWVNTPMLCCRWGQNLSEASAASDVWQYAWLELARPAVMKMRRQQPVAAAAAQHSTGLPIPSHARGLQHRSCQQDLQDLTGSDLRD